MQIGLMLEGQWGLTWARWRHLLTLAEELNFQCVFRSDHYTIGPPDDDSLETFVSLTFAASHTHRIEFGTLVAPTTFRQPALTARMAAAIDDLSGGRFVLGLGTGWHEREHKQFGIPFYDVPTRFEMLEDALEITTRLFQSDVPVSYSGKHYSLDEAIMLPRPQRKNGPPILIGGNGRKKTLPFVARYADEWNAVHALPAACREGNALLDELLAQQGHQPGAVKRSLMLQCVTGNDEAELKAKHHLVLDTEPDAGNIVGVPSFVVDRLGQYSEAGVQRVMLMMRDQTDIDGLELLAKQVLPHFHQ